MQKTLCNKPLKKNKRKSFHLLFRLFYVLGALFAAFTFLFSHVRTVVQSRRIFVCTTVLTWEKRKVKAANKAPNT